MHSALQKYNKNGIARNWVTVKKVLTSAILYFAKLAFKQNYKQVCNWALEIKPITVKTQHLFRYIVFIPTSRISTISPLNFQYNDLLRKALAHVSVCQTKICTEKSENKNSRQMFRFIQLLGFVTYQ